MLQSPALLTPTLQPRTVPPRAKGMRMLAAHMLNSANFLMMETMLFTSLFRRPTPARYEKIRGDKMVCHSKP